MAEDKQYSASDLQAAVTAGVLAAMERMNSQSASSNQAVADALLKAREPYESPQTKANRASAKRSMQEQSKMIKEQREREQKWCSHDKGANPLSADSKPNDAAIAKMRLDTGEIVGICTNCTRVFSSENPADIPGLQRKSTNQMASAGQREFANPTAVKRARLGLDQKEIFVDGDGNILPDAEDVVEMV